MYLNFFLHLDRTDTASKIMETAEADKINPGKPHTDTATTSKVAHPDDD